MAIYGSRSIIKELTNLRYITVNFRESAEVNKFVSFMTLPLARISNLFCINYIKIYQLEYLDLYITFTDEVEKIKKIINEEFHAKTCLLFKELDTTVGLTSPYMWFRKVDR